MGCDISIYRLINGLLALMFFSGLFFDGILTRPPFGVGAQIGRDPKNHLRATAALFDMKTE